MFGHNAPWNGSEGKCTTSTKARQLPRYSWPCDPAKIITFLNSCVLDFLAKITNQCKNYFSCPLIRIPYILLKSGYSAQSIIKIPWWKIRRNSLNMFYRSQNIPQSFPLETSTPHFIVINPFKASNFFYTRKLLGMSKKDQGIYRWKLKILPKYGMMF